MKIILWIAAILAAVMFWKKFKGGSLGAFATKVGGAVGSAGKELMKPIEPMITTGEEIILSTVPINVPEPVKTVPTELGGIGKIDTTSGEFIKPRFNRQPILSLVKSMAV